MERLLVEELHSAFRGRIKKVLPQFKERPSGPLPEDSLLFEWDMGDGFKSYIVLIVMPDYDGVRINGGWSSAGDYPSNYAAVMIPRDLSTEGLQRDEPIDGRFLFDMSLLWEDTFCSPIIVGGRGKSVEEYVEYNLDKCKEYAIPYYQNVFARYGGGGSVGGSFRVHVMFENRGVTEGMSACAGRDPAGQT